MTLSSLSATQGRKYLSLLEKKESLHVELAKVNAEISKLYGGEVVPAKVKGKKPVKVAAKAPRKVAPVGSSKPGKASKPSTGGDGTLKEAIFELLALAGEAGASVRDIAAKLGIKPSHAHVWFATTGKKSGQIHKVGRGVYRVGKGK